MRQIIGVFFGKDEILVKLCFKGLNYHNFTFLNIITNFNPITPQFVFLPVTCFVLEPIPPNLVGLPTI